MMNRVTHGNGDQAISALTRYKRGPQTRSGDFIGDAVM